MSENRPEYQIDGQVISASLAEQMQQIHAAYSTGRKAGEFIISEYSQQLGISYEQGKKELAKAHEKGAVNLRKVGGRNYYSFSTNGG